MKQLKQALTALSDQLQLPGDVLAGVPKIEWIGRQQLSLEPHKGLLEYGTEQISAATKAGTIRINGSELKISLMNSRRMTISGTIEAVRWLPAGNE